MNIVSKDRLFSFLHSLVMIVLLAKILSLLFVLFLPNEGIDFQKKRRMLPPYSSYSMDNIMESNTTQEGLYALDANINSMILTGIYLKNDKGYIILANKSDPQSTEILGLQENYGDYKLIKIMSNSALFEKGEQHFLLEILEGEAAYLEKINTAIVEGQPYQMSHEEIHNYANNLEQILEDISVIEIKNEEEMQGIKVTKIRPNTPFYYLGLLQGDVITKVNNEPIKSYADVLNIYQNLDALQEIEIIVMRNNQEKELHYEIN